MESDEKPKSAVSEKPSATGPPPADSNIASDEARRAKAARAVGALAAAGVGYWLGTELADEPAELTDQQKLVYFVGEEGSPPDLWLGATDVRPGDTVRVAGVVVEARFLKASNWRKLGLEQEPTASFTRVLVKLGEGTFPLFFGGDARARFKQGEPTTIYTEVLGTDATGNPTERLDLGQRGGTQMLTGEKNLKPPLNLEPMVLAAGMGLAVLRGKGKKLTTETERQ